MPRLLTLLALGLLVTACTTHKIPVQQGNVITQESVEKLKPGMDKRQVAAAIGAPLISSTFDPDRWDYLYSLRQHGEETHYSHLVLHFEGETLARVEVMKEPLPEAEMRGLNKPDRGRELF